MATPFTQKLPYDYPVVNLDINDEVLTAGSGSIDLLNIENDIFLEYAILYQSGFSADVDFYISLDDKILVNLSPDADSKGFGFIPILYIINSYYVAGVTAYDSSYAIQNLLSCKKLRLWFYNGAATTQRVYAKIKYFTKV